MISNNPPRFTWHRFVMGCYTTRYLLYVGEEQTPFFVDKAARRAHFTMGKPVGLFGSGMCPKSGCALTLGAFRNVTLAKTRAELLWQEWTETGEMERRKAAGEAGRQSFLARWRRPRQGEAA